MYSNNNASLAVKSVLGDHLSISTENSTGLNTQTWGHQCSNLMAWRCCSETD